MISSSESKSASSAVIMLPSAVVSVSDRTKAFWKFPVTSTSSAMNRVPCGIDDLDIAGGFDLAGPLPVDDAIGTKNVALVAHHHVAFGGDDVGLCVVGQGIGFDDGLAGAAHREIVEESAGEEGLRGHRGAQCA